VGLGRLVQRVARAAHVAQVIAVPQLQARLVGRQGDGPLVRGRGATIAHPAHQLGGHAVVAGALAHGLVLVGRVLQALVHLGGDLGRAQAARQRLGLAQTGERVLARGRGLRQQPQQQRGRRHGRHRMSSR
jgi:hypothetical protein